MKKFSYFIAAFALLLLNLAISPNITLSQYCIPYGYYPEYGYMTRFVFNGIDNSSGYSSTGYSDYSSISSRPCIVGQSYNFSIYGYSLWGSYISGYNIWIDFNRNYTFEPSEWVAGIYDYGYGPNFTGSITIPLTALQGPTRMRINYCGYYYYAYYAYLSGACWSYYYMEWEDYTINITQKSNDAGITNIVSPVDKFNSYQPQNVTVVLKNFGKFFPLTSVTINWSVDGVTQTPYYWSGYLDTGATTQVTIATNYTFRPYAPWNPFRIRVWTSNPRGTDPDANNRPDGDPSNDAFTKDIAPILNDAGFLNADGMIPIYPGVNTVKLRIKNYAPKPLTSVLINWAVNGVAQPSYYWTGNLAAQDSIDVAVGTYDFGTANLPFYIKASTQNPNGYPDDNPNNDEGTVIVYKALAGGTYTIGGRNPDFNTLQDFTSYIAYWGIAGPVTLKIRPGTYDGGIFLQPVGYRQFPITLESFTGRNDDVIIEYTPTGPDNNFVFWIDRLGGVTLRNLIIRNNSCTYGNVIKLTGNVDGLTIDNCSLISCQNPAKNTNFALIYSANSSLNNFRLINSTLRNGSVGLYLVSPSGTNSQNIELGNNIFVSQNWYGAYLDGVSNYNLHDNTISGLNLLYGIYLNGRGIPTIIAPKDDATVSPLASANNTITGNRISGVGPASSTLLNNANAGISINNSLIPVEVTGNTIMGTNTNGIYVNATNYLTVKSNQFTQTSTGSYVKGSIVVYNSGASDNYIMIESNSASNSNTRGIHLENVNYSKIYKNNIRLSSGNYGFCVVTSGNLLIANNIITTQNSGAINFDRITNSMMVYNSFVGTTTGTMALLNNLGSGTNNVFKRNMVYNNGTGSVLHLGTIPGVGAVISDENNLYTVGAFLVTGVFSNIPNLATWKQITGLDIKSVSVPVTFLSSDNPRVAKIDERLYFKYPLSELGPLANEIEKYDIDGNQRTKAYYIGVNSLNPVIRITSAPKDVINCVGSTDNYFSVVAEIDFGGTLSYQWYRYNEEIPGATEAIYMLPPLTNEMAGVFKCKITGNGEAEPVWTEPVLLYAVEPTKITRQPSVIFGDVGSVATFEIDIHVTAQDNPLLQPKIQWYRGSVALQNSDRIAGANSSIMSIKDLKPADFGSDYYVVVEGLCGVDTSKFIVLSQKPRIIAQPLQDQQACQGDNVTFTVVANSSVPGFTLKYQWRFNGVDLQEGGKYTGVNTATLTINDAQPSDAGNYEVLITIEGFDQVVVGPALLSVLAKPVITTDLPETYQVNTGQPIVLTVVASGDNLSYQWYKDNQEINVTEPTLQIQSATADDAGTYKVRVYNQCGEVYSKECVVTVTFKTILEVPGENDGVQLLQNRPNPFESKTRIDFVLPKASNIRLTLSNILGDREIVLCEGNYSVGTHSIEVDANTLGLESGVYVYTLQVDGNRISKYLVLTRDRKSVV